MQAKTNQIQRCRADTPAATVLTVGLHMAKPDTGMLCSSFIQTEGTDFGKGSISCLGTGRECKDEASEAAWTVCFQRWTRGPDLQLGPALTLGGELSVGVGLELFLLHLIQRCCISAISIHSLPLMNTCRSRGCQWFSRRNPQIILHTTPGPGPIAENPTSRARWDRQLGERRLSWVSVFPSQSFSGVHLNTTFIEHIEHAEWRPPTLDPSSPS